MATACWVAFSVAGASVSSAADCDGTSVSLVPLIDLRGDRYLDAYPGGLWPDGANIPRGAHDAEGIARAAQIEPLNRQGEPNDHGRIVFLSIGFSNASQEFDSFLERMVDDDRARNDVVTFVNGAFGGAVAAEWEDPDAPAYDMVRDELEPALSEAQVQIVWLKAANAVPLISLPSPDADAFRLTGQLGNIVRALKVRYPNLSLVFMASRIYAGYADTALNPEPFAYENGFAVKWLIEAQINQMAGGGIDPLTGDLNYGDVAPWLAWGPYFWADGLTPRETDGLIWRCLDFEADGTHPSGSGESKVSARMRDFFLSSPHAIPWMREPIPMPGDCDADQDIDATDFFLYTFFMNGPGEYAPVNFLCGDVNGDSFMDLRDFATYQTILGQ